MIPEFFLTFASDGPVRVQVKFKGHDGLVSDRTMYPREIEAIVSSDDDSFLKRMTFDDWPFEIYRYEIDPLKNVMTIRARPLKEEAAAG
jgi:hypothetical protein